MVLRRKGDRGVGGTCVMGEVPYNEFLCERDMKNTAPNITSLIRQYVHMACLYRQSENLGRPRLKYEL